MAREKLRCTSWWFLSLQITLYFFLILVQGNEEDEAYRSGRSLVLEYFLPINLPAAGEMPPGREKRDVEGSGEDESVFRKITEKSEENEEADNSTQNAFARLILEGGEVSFSNLTNSEGSGEVEDVREFETSTEEDKDDSGEVPIIAGIDNVTTTESDESEEVGARTTQESLTTEEDFISTEMVFDKSEDFEEMKEETTTAPPPPMEVTTIRAETTATVIEETTTEVPVTTESDSEPTTVFSEGEATTLEAKQVETTTPSVTEATTIIPPVVVPEENAPILSEDVIPQEHLTTPKFLIPEAVLNATEGLPAPEISPVPTTREPVVEEIFKESKVAHKTLEAIPGNVLQKENLSLGADPHLITNTRLMDSEETVQLSSSEPKRLGAYIVIGLILLSFSSLVGYITFRKRMNRKRQEFESNQESNDTEKALLSLSDYKDNSELEENHLKNNEKAPIAVKSNSQINKFEKNTNFSSPKNLNTIANEKNIEKDNVLKSTAENLTQVIIEDSPKDVEEEKNAPSMEKLIVRTQIDQDSIPKKPIFINICSGYIPIPQDNS